MNKTLKYVLLSLLIGFGGMGIMVGILFILVTQPVWVQLLVVGGACASVTMFCILTREEHVYLCYEVGEKPEDVRVKAVCTTWWHRESFMNEGDCYREVPVNVELKEPSWEELNYKTKDGYMSVE